MHYKSFFTRKNILILVGIIAALALTIGGVVWAVSSGRGGNEPSSSLPVGASTASTTTTVTTEPSAATTTTDAPTTTTTQPEKKLVVRSHKAQDITVTQPFTHFYGSSDPKSPLTVNGKEVKRDSKGDFSYEQELQPGINKFTFSHKGKEVTYIVRYRFVLVESYSPKENQTYQSGASFAVKVRARTGSKVTATFQNKTLTLTPTTEQGSGQDAANDDTYATYTGSFRLPSDNVADLNMGKVTFKATYKNTTQTYTSGTITCKKATTKVIGEVVAFAAETFNGHSSDDLSRPTNNYLPKGTVDYVTGHAYNGNREYLILRCGRRVYVKKKDSDGTFPVSKEYAGKLPSSNKLSIVGTQVTKRQTILTLDTQWKAPFLLDLHPQKYANPDRQDYTVKEVTAEYVDISFCYASALSGKVELGKNHPVFSSARITKEKNSCNLRLYLRKKGAFYGWDAAYNSKGQLVFTFLHPAQVTPADNVSGADLTGVTVMIDVGHGGKESGTYSIGGNLYEKDSNLILAKELTAQLKACGATVIIDRTTDVSLSADYRCQKLIELKPDICISVHHDGSSSSRPNGFGSFHSTVFSQPAAKLVYKRTMAAKIYNSNASHNRLRWHYFFLARMTTCPVVLTENGFMTNLQDYTGITDPATIRRKAAAICAGVGDYFLSIRQDPPFDPDSKPTTPDSTAPDTSKTEPTTQTETTHAAAATPEKVQTVADPRKTAYPL